jgi:hypothetical protein
VTIAADNDFSVSEKEDHVLGGEASADEGPSGGGKKDEGTSKETLDNDSENTKVLAKGSRAKSMFKSAIKETLQIQKTDSRERYSSYLCIVIFVSNSHLIGPSKTSTTGR